MNRQDLERELVELAKHGDQAAREQLVSKYRPKLVRSLAAFSEKLRDDDHAMNDVVQDTFEKAFRALPSFRSDCGFSTWLHRIGINAANDHFEEMEPYKPPIRWDPTTTKDYVKKHKRRPIVPAEFFREGRRAAVNYDADNVFIEGRRHPVKTLDKLARVAEHQAAVDSEETGGADDALEHVLESEERVVLLDDAVSQLPRRWCEAITLQREGRSYEEIAATMNLSVSAVESLMFRARETLRASLTTDIQKPRSSLGTLFGAALRRQQNAHLVSGIYKRYKTPR